MDMRQTERESLYTHLSWSSGTDPPRRLRFRNSLALKPSSPICCRPRRNFPSACASSAVCPQALDGVRPGLDLNLDLSARPRRHEGGRGAGGPRWTSLDLAAFALRFDLARLSLTCAAGMSRGCVAARAARLVLLLGAFAATVTETKKSDPSKAASISDSNLPPEGGSKYAEIHLAVTRGNVEKLKELLVAGVDVDLRTEEGFTTLHIAVARSQVCPPAKPQVQHCQCVRPSAA
jgi:hypothetical protein